MKRLFGVLICLALLVSGCGGGGGNNDGEKSKTRIACITGAGYYNYQGYIDLLQNYQVTNIDVDNVAATDFSVYKLIIVGAYGEMAQNAVEKIYNSGKPIIGIGSFGRTFFKNIPNASTNYPSLYGSTTTPNGTTKVTVKNKNDIIWSTPNRVIDANTGVVTVRESYELASAVYKANWTNEKNISFGYSESYNNITYDTLCLENKHCFLWGYGEPHQLTYDGKCLFANIVYYMLNL